MSGKARTTVSISPLATRACNSSTPSGGVRSATGELLRLLLAFSTGPEAIRYCGEPLLGKGVRRDVAGSGRQPGGPAHTGTAAGARGQRLRGGPGTDPAGRTIGPGAGGRATAGRAGTGGAARDQPGDTARGAEGAAGPGSGGVPARTLRRHVRA